MEKLGFAKAVTEGGDHWLSFMPQKIGKRSGKRVGSMFSPLMDKALRDDTHDRLDAAWMRLCNDDNDAIRKCFREGM